MGLYDDDPDPSASSTELAVVEFGWGFAFTPPPAWIRKQRDDAAMVSPADGALESFNVLMRALDHVPTVEELGADASARLRSDLPGCQLSERRFITVAGIDGYQLAFTFSQRGDAMRGRQVVTVHGNVAIIATYVARAAHYDSCVGDADRMLASLRLIAP